MKDVEFCASLILLYKKGIIDQTDQTALNQAYSDYQLEYDDAESDKEYILQALEMLEFFLDDHDILLFLRRKVQLYTFFCILFSMLRQQKKPEDQLKENLHVFVMLYALFNNDMEPTDILSEHEGKIFDILKKYKLASSEGLNKYSNRMIRFSALNDFLFNSNLQKNEAAVTLGRKLKTAVKDDSQEHTVETDE